MLLKASLDNLETIMQFVTTCAQRIGLTEKRTFEINLAVEEGLVNVFNYAYPEIKDGWIEVSCLYPDSNSLVIKIIDTGLAFNPLSKADPDMTGSIDERPIGLGIYFIKQLADDIQYIHENEKNILALTFTNRS